MSRTKMESKLPEKDPVKGKDSESLSIEPAPTKSLLAILDQLNPIREKFPPIVELPGDQIDL